MNGSLSFYFSSTELKDYNKILTKPSEEKAIYINDHPTKFVDLDIELNYDYDEVGTDTLDHVEWVIYAFQNGLFLLRDQEENIVKRYFIDEKGYKSFSLQVPPMHKLTFQHSSLDPDGALYFKLHL